MDKLEKYPPPTPLTEQRKAQFRDSDLAFFAAISDELVKTPQELLAGLAKSLILKGNPSFENKTNEEIDKTLREIFAEKNGGKSPEQVAELLNRSPEELARDVQYTETKIREGKENPTHLMEGREGLRDSLVSSYFDTIPHEKDVTPPPKVTFIIGPPAAGKSTLSDKIQHEQGAIIVDVDIVSTGEGAYKGVSDDFAGGFGADKVHEESGMVTERIRSTAREKGLNIVLPMLGGKSEKLRKLGKEFKEAGYQVDLMLNDLPIEKCIQRNYTRYLQDFYKTEGKVGRLVPLNVLLDCDDKPYRAFCELVNEQNNQPENERLFSNFSAYSNDVNYGEPAREIDIESMLPPISIEQQVTLETAADWDRVIDALTSGVTEQQFVQAKTHIKEIAQQLREEKGLGDDSTEMETE